MDVLPIQYQCEALNKSDYIYSWKYTPWVMNGIGHLPCKECVGSIILWNDVVQYTKHACTYFFPCTQLLSFDIIANLLIFRQMENRNVILMLWQPEPPWRQLEQVLGDSKDIFFLIIIPCLNHCLSTKNKANKKALHTHCQGTQNDLWLTQKEKHMHRPDSNSWKKKKSFAEC